MQTFLFFLDNLSAFVLELLIIFFSIFGIVLSFYGLSYIPFYIGKKIIKSAFETNIIFLAFILLIALIFVIFRKLYLINNKLNKCSYYSSIVLISISLLGFILNVIIDPFIINYMLFYNRKAKKNQTTELTSKEWKDTLLVIIFLFILYFLFIFLGLSDNLRINLKIDDSYYQYQLAIEEEYNHNEQNLPNINIKNNREKKNIEIKDKNYYTNKNDHGNIQVNVNEQLPGSDNDLNKQLGQNEEKKI